MNETPNDYPPLSPALAVRDAAKAIEFYKAAFDAVERFRLVDPESGKIGHAELTINGCLIMLADEYPAYNKAPQTLGHQWMIQQEIEKVSPAEMQKRWDAMMKK